MESFSHGNIRLLSLAFEKFQYSARTYNKFLKIARTFADLDASENIRKQDISAALMARDTDIGNLLQAELQTPSEVLVELIQGLSATNLT